jgi:hypothetical protein
MSQKPPDLTATALHRTNGQNVRHSRHRAFRPLTTPRNTVTHYRALQTGLPPAAAASAPVEHRARKQTQGNIPTVRRTQHQKQKKRRSQGGGCSACAPHRPSSSIQLRPQPPSPSPPATAWNPCIRGHNATLPDTLPTPPRPAAVSSTPARLSLHRLRPAHTLYSYLILIRRRTQ